MISPSPNPTLRFSVLTADNPEATRTIEQTLAEIDALQTPLLIDRQAKDTENGFLIGSISNHEIQALLAEGAQIHLARDTNGVLLAFAMMTSIQELTVLYTDRTDGRLTLNYPAAFSEEEMQSAVYLHRIALKADQRKTGLGTKLVQEIQRQTSHPIVTDILCQPIFNEASLRFFQKNSFQEFALLYLDNYRDFGQLVSKVLVWKP